MRAVGRRERGFTLVELLVVIAILGILAATAVVYTKTDRVGDGARQVSALLQEARRHAMSLGAVRPDVALATGNRARSRVEFTTVAGRSTVYLWDYVEDPAPATTGQWKLASSVSLPTEVEIAGIAAVAVPDPGLALPATLGATTRDYYTDGSADAMTVFLRKRNTPATHPDRYRIFVLPLSAMPQTLKGW